MKVTIEVTDENQFNLGWLLYVLGQDRPAYNPEDSYGDSAASGWDMGKETGGMLKQVRDVFDRQRLTDQPQYVINVEVPVVVNDQNAVVVAPTGKGKAAVTDAS